MTELAELYRSFAHVVLRRAERMLGTRAEAEDVLHDLFVRLHERPAELERMSEPAAFIYGATTHACLNRLRDGRTRARLLAERGHDGRMSAQPEGEVRVLLHEALTKLPEDLQAIAIYYYLDRMTQEEIAEIVGCSRRTVSDHRQIRCRVKKACGCNRTWTNVPPVGNDIPRLPPSARR